MPPRLKLRGDMKSDDSQSVFWAKGLRFKCISCGRCCRHEPGYVFLSPQDLRGLSRHLDLDEKTFTETFCREVNIGGVKRLSLNETDVNDCVFWKNGCSVYRARPLQCRTYPFWSGILASEDEWIRESGVCPGIGIGPLHSKRRIASDLKRRERQVLISPCR